MALLYLYRNDIVEYVGISTDTRHTEANFGRFIMSKVYRNSEPDFVVESKLCAYVNNVATIPSSLNLVLNIVLIKAFVSASKSVHSVKH